MNPGDDELAALVRQALQEEAERVHPAGDGLERIRQRTRRRPLLSWSHPRGEERERSRPGPWPGSWPDSWWGRSAVGLSVAVFVGAATAGVVLSARPEPARTRPQTLATASNPSLPASRTPPAAAAKPSAEDSASGAPASRSTDATPPPRRTASVGVQVYYLGNGGDGALKLYREYQNVPRTASMVRGAVDAMLSHRPSDPDYQNLWPAGQVRNIEIMDDTIVVDLPARVAGRRNMPEEAAKLCVQQLVYTATDAAGHPDWGVRLRVGGRDLESLWGYRLGEVPLRRATKTAVEAPVWISRPKDGEVVGTSFVLEGEAAGGGVSWEVTRADGVVKQKGEASTTGSSVGEDAGEDAGEDGRETWRQELTLPAGTYVVRARKAPKGAGSPASADTKTVVVR